VGRREKPRTIFFRGFSFRRIEARQSAEPHANSGLSQVASRPAPPRAGARGVRAQQPFHGRTLLSYSTSLNAPSRTELPGLPFARCGRALGLESRRAAIALDPAQQDQHEQDHDDQSEPAAVVAGAGERSSAHTGEPADEQDDKNNQDDRCSWSASIDARAQTAAPVGRFRD
jgi:hypothetical protein